MRGALFVLLLMFLCAARAQSPSTAAKPAEPGTLTIICNPVLSELRIFDAAYAPAMPPRPGDRVSRTDWYGLVIYEKHETAGFALRAGSRKKRHTCGPWRLVVAEGFYSASPGGRSGIFTFPDLTVYAGAQEILRTQLDAGDETTDTSSECSDMSNCPHTLILRLCPAPPREQDGGACAKVRNAEGSRLFVERRWFDEEKKERRRIDEPQ
ncbi:MAG: hypothetical protein JWN73_2373 [Betaproteobacteria bacterium]|nr:hypothetical protein [Betaproteobacteria bacterium]